MADRDVLIVPTGAANLASVRAGLLRLDITAREDATADFVAKCGAVVLPGVGAFGSAMKRLHADGVIEALQERVTTDRPTVAICLGMQLLCRESEESPGVQGLGVVPESITRFNGDLRVPHMGWNRVEAGAGCGMIESGDAYFANSYRLCKPPVGWSVALCDYGGAFVCAMERGNVLACQFHPELSGAWGLALLRRWLQLAGVLPC